MRAQADMVPAEHPVYAFLLQQRVRGHLPDYVHEMRPTSRGEVLAWLHALQKQALSSREYRWVARYLREFEEKQDDREQFWGHWRPLLGKHTEKYLYYYADAVWRVGVRLAFELQYRYAEDSLRAWGIARVPELTIKGTFRDRLGFYSSLFQGSQPIGSTYTLTRDPFLRPLYYVSLQEKPPGGFDRSTASVRYEGTYLYGELAHARVLIGSSPAHSLILTDNADYFSHIKVGVRTRRVRYLFLHGALGARSQWYTNPDDPRERALLSPQRFLALHRIAFRTRPLTLAFTEMVVYANRSPELAYLNPVQFYKSAEQALWDRDNALFALEAQWHPRQGIEGYGTWLVDDLSVQDLGKGSIHNRFGWQVGIMAAPLDGGLLWVEYTRLDPFLYTHRFRLNGIAFNAYTHNGYGLGHPLGPHADQLMLGGRFFSGQRWTADVRLTYTRRGENTRDAQGRWQNVGGDILNGDIPPEQKKMPPFLSGKRVEGPGAELALTWEPLRGYWLMLYGRVHAWNREPDEGFLRLQLRIDW